MILSAGPPDSVSFTDDTSLDQRKTAGSKVSIHCQVLRERSLDWYYRLLQRVPNKPGELKSSDVTNTLLGLSPSERLKVFGTLKFVRVNITDPRPYIADFDGILGHIIPGVNAKDFLARLEQAHMEVAERVRQESRRFLARRMLWGSPSERLEDNKSCINVNSVSVFVSKSGSVLYPALDEVDDAAPNLQWPATAWDAPKNRESPLDPATSAGFPTKSRRPQRLARRERVWVIFVPRNRKPRAQARGL